MFFLKYKPSIISNFILFKNEKPPYLVANYQPVSRANHQHHRTPTA
ncbi:hypothetical protein [Moraxella lacunata]